jgi:hypothetical protein
LIFITGPDEAAEPAGLSNPREHSGKNWVFKNDKNSNWFADAINKLTAIKGRDSGDFDSRIAREL